MHPSVTTYEKTRMSPPTEVIMHPLVLLSVVDHFTRMQMGLDKRVAGVLLGISRKGVIDVTNSFAVPFDEDPKSSNVFFLDHNYIENMYGMSRKINARERIVGWYSSGPKIRPNDIDIHQVLRNFAEHPVYCVFEINPKDEALPVSSYVVTEEIADENSKPQLTFKHVFSRIGALEAEEIGVEHLLRDVQDRTASTLSTHITDKVNALRSLADKVGQLTHYLKAVQDGTLPINQSILYKVQEMINVLPVLHLQSASVDSSIQTNDEFMSLYITSLMRTILGMHDLILNKRQLQKAKEEKRIKDEKKKQEEEEKKAKEEEEKKKKEEEEKLKKEVEDAVKEKTEAGGPVIKGGEEKEGG